MRDSKKIFVTPPWLSVTRIPEDSSEKAANFGKQVLAVIYLLQHNKYVTVTTTSFIIDWHSRCRDT
jgi:hypothetical protein